MGGFCREQVSSYQKRRLGVSAPRHSRPFLCRTLTTPPSTTRLPSPRQPRLNNTHTFTAAARLRRSRAARRPTPEPPETHILQSADELLKTHPAPPCFLHGLELAGCCIVKRPLAWRPGCEWTRHFSICRFNPEKFSLDTRLRSRQALITAPPLLPLTPLPSFLTCIYVSRSLHTHTHTERTYIYMYRTYTHTNTHMYTYIYRERKKIYRTYTNTYTHPHMH